MVIWLVGLSGVGKSTIAQGMQRQWQAHTPNVVMVDGDEVRRLCAADLAPADYSLAGRRRNAERMVEFCAWLDGQGMHVICAILCLFDDLMLANRARFAEYYQVTLEASLAVLEARDPKGLYARARSGELTQMAGLDLPFTPPSQPDLIVRTDDDTADAETLATRILTAAGVFR